MGFCLVLLFAQYLLFALAFYIFICLHLYIFEKVSEKYLLFASRLSGNLIPALSLAYTSNLPSPVWLLHLYLHKGHQEEWKNNTNGDKIWMNDGAKYEE